MPTWKLAASGVMPVGLFIALCATELAAGPPLSIDDPGILEPGEVEIIVAGAIEDGASDNAYALPILDLSFGLTANVQMSAAATRVILDPDEGESKSDFGPGAVGVKWRFLKRGPLEMSVAPYFETLLRDGAAERGVVEDVDAWKVPVQFQYQFPGWRLNAEVGYAVLDDTDDEWSYGVAAARPISETLELMAEIHGGVLKDLHDHGVLYRVGLDWSLREKLHLLAAVGSGIHESGDEDLDVQGYLGLQWFR